MIFRPKGKDDCCCKSWKDKINELWEKYQGVVKGVKAGSVTAYPDGDGIADLDGAVADAIAQQVPPMLTDLVTESELSTALEDYPTETDLTQTLEDYATQTDLETKQDVLVSGETIRTINGRDLLGEGNLQFNDILPDFSEAAEGDALVIGSEGLPEWGEVDPLPDTTEASAGDALVLDANKLPVWGDVDPLPTTTANDHYRPLLTDKNGDGWIVGPVSGTISNSTPRTGTSQTIAPGEVANFTIQGRKGQSNILVPKFNNNPTQNIEILGSSQTDSATTTPRITVKVRNNGNNPIPPNSNLDVVISCYSLSVPITNDGTYFTSIVFPASSPIKELPDYTSADAGKVLSVASDGTLEWITLP